jgi:hypothetical protein
MIGLAPSGLGVVDGLGDGLGGGGKKEQGLIK